jgi:hypothetical protein
MIEPERIEKRDYAGCEFQDVLGDDQESRHSAKNAVIFSRPSPIEKFIDRDRVELSAHLRIEYAAIMVSKDVVDDVGF